MKTEITEIAHPYDWFNLEIEREALIRTRRRVRLDPKEIRNTDRDIPVDNIPSLGHLIDPVHLSRESIDSTKIEEIFNSIIVDLEVIV
jgi:hypothetical protein